MRHVEVGALWAQSVFGSTDNTTDSWNQAVHLWKHSQAVHEVAKATVKEQVHTCTAQWHSAILCTDSTSSSFLPLENVWHKMYSKVIFGRMGGPTLQTARCRPRQ